MKTVAFSLAFFFVLNNISAQNQSTPIITGVPFLLIESDSRITGMGEIGVVASPIYFEAGLRQNPALLAQNKRIIGGRVSRNDWLPQLNIPGLAIIDIGGYYSISKNHTIGIHGRQFRLGQIQLTDPNGQVIGNDGLWEISQSLRYAMSISNNLSVGIGFTYFHSQINPQGARITPAKGIVGDLGINYQKKFSIEDDSDLLWTIGASVLNIGPKVSYDTANVTSNFVPTNFQLGTLLGYYKSLPGNTRLGIELAYQASKLLVPTESFRSDQTALEGIFSSFGDAPGGFSEELQEIIHQVGLEGRIQYKGIFMGAVRMGTFLEHGTKGARQYLTLGSGIGVHGFRLDAAYILPYNQAPFRGFRFGFSGNFDLDQKGLRLMEW